MSIASIKDSKSLTHPFSEAASWSEIPITTGWKFVPKITRERVGQQPFGTL
jgi:hypothetical protein